ncbi:L-seryl-tRNA(Sec) selenium transferase [Campylobacterota bacterium]|nr:L-seryl-tRNA(Sec) selenium transferase [Campylobacterota bacterium]
MPTLRDLPKVDLLAQRDELSALPAVLRTRLIRESLEAIRQKVRAGETAAVSIEAIVADTLRRYDQTTSASLKPLINASGVVIHTNFGRSVLDPALYDELKPLMTSYTNLEYDLDGGVRGERYSHLEKLTSRLLGFESSIVVNNNAAAVFLALHTFARAKEAVVSRGELVEIGGSFRIPEVMRESGAILREIGTTNKTRIADYESAITENTAVLMKVHRSNFKISGFTSEAGYDEIAALAAKRGIIDYYDLGSGQIVSLGSKNEPLLGEIAALSPSLVSFSGDKLFAGVQAGIICGKKSLIDKIKKNQLLRMLRVDKFTIAALEATLLRYLTGRENSLPTIALLRADRQTLNARATRLCELIAPMECTIEETQNFAGGGSLPEEDFAGVAVVFGFGGRQNGAKIAQERLRKQFVIARCESEKLYIEMRTVFDRDVERLGRAIKEAL